MPGKKQKCLSFKNENFPIEFFNLKLIQNIKKNIFFQKIK
jgi:hypothetical protein